MAQLTKAVLGRFSGRIGDTVFRQRNGKNFVGTRPRSYTPPANKGSVDRRSRFTFSTKLAQAVYSIPELAAVWKPKTPDGMTTPNYIFQKNVLVVNPASVSDLTTITPEHGFPVVCSSAALAGNNVAIALAAIGTASGIDVTKEPNGKVACVLCLSNPSNGTYPDFMFVSGTSDTKPLTLDSALSFNIALSGQDAASVGAYADRKILLALVTLNAANAPVEYSGTVVSTVSVTP